MDVVFESPVALIAAGVALAAVITVVLLAFWPGRYDRARILNGNRYRITRLFAFITAAGAGLVGVVDAWQIAIAETVRVPLRGPGLSIASELNDLSASPTNGGAPLHPEPATGSIVIVGIQADVGVAEFLGADPAVRFWLILQVLLTAALIVTIAVAVARVCTALLSGEPFQKPVTTWMRVSAWVFLGAGLGAQAALAGARAVVVDQVTQRPLPAEFQEPGDPWGIAGALRFVTNSWVPEFNPWPIGVCLARLALSAVFNAGTRLRRDVDGLV
ncbi:hypothetical protein D9V32_09710 [Mycetocola tolaasinivorans]|uniref:DUF2975 domain-containing protein n=1 Tax=Mycetocola tolaasinivorans TaxID=76635 RepID=A0A3L7A5Z8_9MICO|nr:hypothetical protein [Mycetocola tolaasinivorans]RLP75729.1 hypothetical protein D9V32_09710 [Mycetocola tolaasinivorans]